jgi:tRNA(fMet)-specific endonuclease VapC
MYLLDTNICIALMNSNRNAIRIFNQFFQAENLNSLDELTQLLDVVPFTTEAALEFGIIQNELKQLAKPTGELDALIAAVARSRHDMLVTNNTRDFQHIPNLQIEDWL